MKKIIYKNYKESYFGTNAYAVKGDKLDSNGFKDGFVNMLKSLGYDHVSAVVLLHMFYHRLE